MRRAALVLAACLGCSGAAAPPGDAERGTPNAERPAPAAAPAQIDRAIAALGDPSPAVRDRALESLVTLGDAVVPALKRARDATTDPEARSRLDRALEALGEEGTYVAAIAALRGQDYRAARAQLDRYLAIARGRYREQAEYLHGEAVALLARQESTRATMGGPMERARTATPGDLWNDAAHHHNVFLFFRSRGVEAPDFRAQALTAYETVLARQPDERRGWACLAALQAAAGDRPAAEAAWARARAIPVQTGWDLMDDAAYHAACGDADAAFASLREALPRCADEDGRAGHDPDKARRWVRTSNDFDALRADPRFAELVAEPR